MVTAEGLFKIFSDVAEDEERSFGDRIKAAEFLMKYRFSKNESEQEDRVVIIDDISTRMENRGH